MYIDSSTQEIWIRINFLEINGSPSLNFIHYIFNILDTAGQKRSYPLFSRIYMNKQFRNDDIQGEIFLI